VQQRVYGTVDYKKARYVILPEQTVRQALFIDSKAEKENRSATIQMSQTSMWVRQRRSGAEVNEKRIFTRNIRIWRQKLSYNNMPYPFYVP